MFLACFYFEVSENLVRIYDIMDSMKYWEVLNVSTSAKMVQLGQGWIIQQDCYPKHKSKYT